MPKKMSLTAYKHGDVQRGNWSWAVGAATGLEDRHLCVAGTNFHGCRFAGYDSEQVANLFAAAPDLLDAATTFLSELDGCDDFAAWEHAKQQLRNAVRTALGAA